MYCFKGPQAKMSGTTLRSRLLLVVLLLVIGEVCVFFTSLKSHWAVAIIYSTTVMPVSQIHFKEKVPS